MILPFLIVDALLKIREDGRLKSYSTLIATDTNRDGYRKILGMERNSESEQSWLKFFRNLKQRDLKGVDFIVSNHNGGLINAVANHFQEVTWQRYQTFLPITY
ncbi:MAG TPA: hypothetical protein GXX35_10870 [Thermoanaerobacterales bacterium]|nr:hypothetical protein [Thermoanaerobacterales bacterium]